ncbi:MAG: hypothetical protein JWL57_524 [Actinobacteria bacterium]|nr:hypothetical protein [Actinomycetota bacterium]
MRGPQRWALAVRRPDGGISTEAHALPWSPADHPWIRKPFIRGVNVVVESLAIGMRALRISAGYSLTGGEVEGGPGGSSSPPEWSGEDPAANPPWDVERSAGADDIWKAQVSERQLGWTMGIAIAVFAAVFIAAPALVTKLGGHVIGVNSSLGQNLIEGGIRLGLFLGYITLISLIPDIRRVYQYHGAEHKTIAAYENGDPLQPEVVDRYSTLHVRCGTNFLFIVLFLTILVGLALDFLLPHVVLLRVAARILVIPLLAAFGYEIIRAASRDEHSLAFRVASLPGLALQKITTRAPDRDQIEVAIKAMEAVIAAEALAAGTVEPAP